MESIVMTYEGYSLYEAPQGYLSTIDGKVVKFDTAVQWKQFIDYKNGKGKKKSNSR
jgi:hypothetical protein